MQDIASPSRFCADRQGIAAVEFALVLPILLILTFGILCYGSYFGVLNGVQQLAAEAARASIAGLTDTERVAAAKANIASGASSYPFLSPARLSVSSATTDPVTNAFTVTLTYDASDMVIFRLPQFVPLPPSTIARSATIQKGGY